MIYRIRYTPKFVEDVEKIREDIKIVSGRISTADNYIRDFTKKIKKMKQFPESGKPLMFDDYFTGYYFVHFKAYNAFYRIVGDYIEFIRALPSKSDYMKTLLGEYYDEDMDTSDEADYINESADEQHR